MIRPLCFMCEKRRAKPLTARRDGDYYVNAQDIVLFCSMKCAANYALLWGAPEIMGCHHFCSTTRKWEMCEESECFECHPSTKEV